MYKTPKEVQERKDAKKKHIQKTALKVFSSRGYHGTSVKDIVDEAGVSVGSFYFYFKNKEELFETLYDEVALLLFNSLHSALDSEELNNKNMAVGITSFLLAVKENCELTKIMMVEAVGLNPRFERKRAEAAKMFVKHAAEFMRDERIRKTGVKEIINPDITATAFIGSVYHVVENWLSGNLTESLEELALNLIIYNTRALGSECSVDEVRGYIHEVLEQKKNARGGDSQCFLKS